MSKNSILHEKIKAVNIGAELFAEALIAQQVETVQLSWTPPRKVTLDSRIADILDRME